ncbi:unnamed protein product [Plutella xylostella]|uniref:(diamondback moth) hypothetical protein n=1 Tax=Plutella xylostella TaxID=51655 RepID=A0A8S4FEX8_PLUXY|nr:unnamed protein product [Plutella xylostella]
MQYRSIRRAHYQCAAISEYNRECCVEKERLDQFCYKRQLVHDIMTLMCVSSAAKLAQNNKISAAKLVRLSRAQK